MVMYVDNGCSYNYDIYMYHHVPGGSTTPHVLGTCDTFWGRFIQKNILLYNSACFLYIIYDLFANFVLVTCYLLYIIIIIIIKLMIIL